MIVHRPGCGTSSGTQWLIFERQQRMIMDTMHEASSSGMYNADTSNPLKSSTRISSCSILTCCMKMGSRPQPKSERSNTRSQTRENQCGHCDECGTAKAAGDNRVRHRRMADKAGQYQRIEGGYGKVRVEVGYCGVNLVLAIPCLDCSTTTYLSWA
jgi:hypothetical protein